MKLIVEHKGQKVRKEVDTDLSQERLLEIIRNDVYWSVQPTPIKWLALITKDKIHLKMWSDNNV
jgi:hypothetical protein